ncbi:MAG: hypothetical protein U0169_22190 [Polyangiaceae bacterium]
MNVDDSDDFAFERELFASRRAALTVAPPSFGDVLVRMNAHARTLAAAPAPVVLPVAARPCRASLAFRTATHLVQVAAAFALVVGTWAGGGARDCAESPRVRDEGSPGSDGGIASVVSLRAAANVCTSAGSTCEWVSARSEGGATVCESSRVFSGDREDGDGVCRGLAMSLRDDG